jgi:hypothetical protein
MALPTPIALPLRVTADVLETTAGVLRAIAGTPTDAAAEVATAATRAPARAATATADAAPEPEPEPVHAHAGTTPAAGTRSQVQSPKAARKVRKRRASS